MRASVTDALTRSLFREWAEVGYGALSLERVAKRAGVGKAALYRRWSCKLDMAVERVETLGIDLAEFADTGTFKGDVRALVGQLRQLLRHPIVRRVLPDLQAEMLRSPELAKAVRGRLQVVRRERGKELIRRAIARGELSNDVDMELLLDAFAGLIYWRMIATGRRSSDQYLDELTRAIVAIAHGSQGAPGTGHGR